MLSNGQASTSRKEIITESPHLRIHREINHHSVDPFAISSTLLDPSEATRIEQDIAYVTPRIWFNDEAASRHFRG